VKRLILFAMLSACNTSLAKKDIAPAPTWATEDGRTQAKLELAEALLLNGNPEAALHMLAQLQKHGSRNTALLVVQGKALSAIGLTDEAEKVFLQATRRSPANVDAQNQLGILYLDRQETDSAIKRFRSAARSAPKDAQVHNNYGFALMAAGRHEDAVDVLRKALMLDGSQERTRNNLGFSLATVGNDKAAWRVLRAGSNDASARYNLALAQELRGDMKMAIKSYKQALEANPDMSEATEALARLSSAVDPAVSSPVQEK
jgi:Flp pilus assembly protein TadD